jgi:hypothetical protein
MPKDAFGRRWRLRNATINKNREDGLKINNI